MRVLILAIGAIGDQCVCIPDEGSQFLDIGTVVKAAGSALRFYMESPV